jgi:hypothetical protein
MLVVKAATVVMNPSTKMARKLRANEIPPSNPLLSANELSAKNAKHEGNPNPKEIPRKNEIKYSAPSCAGFKKSIEAVAKTPIKIQSDNSLLRPYLSAKKFPTNAKAVAAT